MKQDKRIQVTYFLTPSEQAATLLNLYIRLKKALLTTQFLKLFISACIQVVWAP